MKVISGLAGAAMIISLAVPALAQTDSPNPSWRGQDNGSWQGRGPGMMNGLNGRGPGMMKPGIFGTVTALSGTTLTVVGRSFVAPGTGTNGVSTASTTFTVDASAATVFKNNATSSLAAVALNDRVFVQGTVNGTSVAATTIRDGLVMMRGRGPGWTPGSIANGGPGGLPSIQGNGQPVVAGTVSGVSGTTFTITTSSNTGYTIDASTAQIVKNNASSTVSAISNGDYVIVQGAVNGSSITASSVIDGPSQNSNTPPVPGIHPGGGLGFFGSIGNFFRHLFGF
ncbi:MAG: hypothetical protein KGI59_02525 [Patescibacteria group bacterium]|nr:hypothetical protein [Patescibacteria group bacterium]MDE2172660.1 hypothetical protein [Patescibacteria group bacterium]